MIIVFAGLVTLVGTIAIFLITSWVISNARSVESAETVATGLYRIRQRYFLVLTVVISFMLLLTLPALPYTNLASKEPEFIVPESARIWSWEIGPVQTNSKNPQQARNDTLILPLGKAIEFQVTAVDVNHGFGIYDETGQLIAQTQAMPGYVNKLVHTFAEPGTYHVLCMEYCGLAHHNMVTTMLVE